MQYYRYKAMYKVDWEEVYRVVNYFGSDSDFVLSRWI